ncbi:MAG: homocysteine S-methyltransferase family protein [Streptosporangiales bacterium]
MNAAEMMAPAANLSRVRLRQEFARRVVVCDGAMGTMLHAAGVPLDRALCELNSTQPRLVRDLHAAYVAAGAGIVQANTFDANRMRLARVGLEESVVELNIAGARLAREAVEAAGHRVLVAGSVGPATNASVVPLVPNRAGIVREQVSALADWVDLLIFETFGDVDSLVQAVEIALAETELPVIAQMTFGDDGRTLRGEAPADVAAVLGELDLAALGANCTVGPAVLQDVVAELARAVPLPVSVQPNAGMPRRLGDQVRYAHDTAYFADAARQFVAAGATIIGGCCGTTPAHIRAIARAVSGLEPRRARVEPPASRRADTAATAREGASAAWPPADRFAVLASIEAPRGEVDAFVDQARELVAAGADALAITDAAPPMARVNPVAAGVVLRERVGAEVLLPVETAAHSLAALQADLLGAQALGLRMLVCRTGAPRVAGGYPDPASLWGVDSVRLISALTGLNNGTDWRGVPIPDRTGFVVGAMVNTSAADVERELDRVDAKVRAGAHFLLTEAIYDVDEAESVLSALRVRGVDIPVVCAVAPFVGRRAIERLRHELPEVAASRPGQAGPRGSRMDAVTETVAKLRHLVSGVTVHVPPSAGKEAADVVARIAGQAHE